ATAIFEMNFGPRHPMMATLLNNAGVIYQTMGAGEQAEKNYQAVLSLAGSSISSTSPTLGHAHNNLGELLAQRDQHRQAAGHFMAAVKIWEQAHGPNHPLIAHPLLGLARARMALGQPQVAVGLLVRAKQLRAGNDAGQQEIQAELDRVGKTAPEPSDQP
ncbi:MAG: tetratricopeptide repeat protein, partial [Nannocystaceae bacterium]